ncbi:MAG: hypothetical protein PHS41_09870, partial [Victivallaceae bacterium]|nr:hypothetical protein [Victivallaceae bacterium]
MSSYLFFGIFFAFLTGAAAWLFEPWSKRAAVTLGCIGVFAGSAAGGLEIIRTLGTTGIDLPGFFRLPILLLGPAGALHAARYLSDSARKGVFYCFYNATFAAMLAVTCLTSHWLFFLIAWEFMGAFSFALVLFEHAEHGTGKAA